MNSLTRLLKWAERNERHLGAVVFVFGFVTDLFAFTLLPVAVVNIAFLGYLFLAGAFTLGSHYFSGARTHVVMWRRTLAVVFPLGAQYAIGSLLSGCLIFYTKSSTVLVSWPFLLILALVFIGNEYFRTYHKHLAFQATLFFFALYAYAIFAVPLVFGELGPVVFLTSTVVSLFAFALFLLLLARIHRPGFTRSLRYVVMGTAGIVLAMNICYFTGLIPPIPLTLPHAGIYHSVEHRNGQYHLTSEPVRPWWDIRPQVIHHTPGAPLYAFSSVSAPIQFGTSVTHIWERYDERNTRWVTYNRIAFPISGGRDAGYRGYSLASNPEAGKWRVTIQAANRQVIGRIYFTVETVAVPPPRVEEIR